MDVLICILRNKTQKRHLVTAVSQHCWFSGLEPLSSRKNSILAENTQIVWSQRQRGRETLCNTCKNARIHYLEFTMNNMTESEITCWIFLALAISSKQSNVDTTEISKAADFINHLVPTRLEIDNSLSWLVSAKFILKIDHKYTLSKKGKEIFSKACEETNGWTNVWHNLKGKIVVTV